MRKLIVPCLRTLCLLLCGSLLIACGYELHDDIDLTLNFGPLIGPSETLHTPYVKGARFHVFLDDVSTSNRIGAGWRVESDNPAVLAISEVKVQEYENDGKTRRYLQAAAAALDEGQTAIIVRNDNGDEVFRAPAEVLRPDRIDLLAHGPLIIGRPEEQAVMPAFQVLTGGTATFLARYYRGERQLFGNGTLSVATPNATDLGTQVRRTFLFEDRDWLSITALREGTTQVELLAAGEPISRVAVTGVGEAALGQARLSQTDRVLEGKARNKDREVVLAETFDRQGQPIYGVEYTWSYGGTPQTGLGDLYRYEFKRGMVRMLSAKHGAMAAELMIEGKEGFVDSTNDVGCGMAGHAGGGGWVAVGLLGLTLALRRRRRVRSGAGGWDGPVRLHG